MDESSKYVLAMYDVRGKQAFIFRTNKIKEIVGGSLIIRDLFKDYLYPAAKEYRNKLYGETEDDAIYRYNIEDKEKFDVNSFKKRMSGKQYMGEVVYDGGGNFLVLYESEEVFKGVNKIFTRKILENIGSLNVICTAVEVDGNLSDYKGDNKRLYEKHELLENSESVVRPVNGIPFIQIDPSTSMPLSELCMTVESDEKQNKSGKFEKVSTESAAKYKKYADIAESNEEYGEKVLDNLVKEKGKDSLLAVIFIDGNNMGAQVQGLFEGDCSVDYETRVSKLRGFSAEIQENYVTKRVAAIRKRLAEKYKNSEKQNRMVVFAGDEMSFVVRAEDALDAVKAYFEDLEGGSSCAGIAIFHSHAPYAEAYKIAEECCETGKKRMKEQNPPETGTCYVDFQICHSGMGRSLDTMREEETGELCSKPWLIKDNSEEKADNGAVSLDEIEAIVNDLNALGSRTNVKSLVQAAEKSLNDFNMEMERIYAHQSKEIQEKINDTFCKEHGDEHRRKMVYDIATVYDIWFRKQNIAIEETEVQE